MPGCLLEKWKNLKKSERESFTRFFDLAGRLFYTSDGGREGHRGMGLYAARQAAQAHGGGLSLFNTPRGACALLRLRALCGAGSLSPSAQG